MEKLEAIIDNIYSIRDEMYSFALSTDTNPDDLLYLVLEMVQHSIIGDTPISKVGITKNFTQNQKETVAKFCCHISDVVQTAEDFKLLLEIIST